MLDLYCLDGAEARTIQRLKSALRFEQGLAIESISFEPLKGAPEELINFSHQGVDYGPSLPPSYRMRVVYDAEDKFTSLFTLGQNEDGEWRIICAKPTNERPPELQHTPAPI
ncbi:hypothetical protein [Coraliomargarita akajimensis]|nr:hypothetical protein [Coraliomargarita akajimensis]